MRAPGRGGWNQSLAEGGGSTGSVSVSDSLGCVSGLSGQGWVDPALRRC